MVLSDGRRSFKNRDAWRAWLTENYATTESLWLVFHKKHTGKAGLTYDEAVEEALCFGWIDGILKRIDDEKHMNRFCPRRKNSVWSERNKERVGRMIEAGRMTEAGLAKIREAKENGQWDKAAEREDVSAVPTELAEALATDARAGQNFERLAPSYRWQFIQWVGSAKREETRRKRVAEAIAMLRENKRLGMQ
ncbi:MAG TPA: YdeI/OmpD-associated family protein [Sedimentisphaerales bacterium]|nr:YdeI/OmpD-associated family protein [Sedimentisphaerales bacterium]